MRLITDSDNGLPLKIVIYCNCWSTEYDIWFANIILSFNVKGLLLE